MLGALSNLMEVGSCCEAALLVDWAVPKPRSSKRDAKLCDSGTLGVRPLNPLGNKGYADILQCLPAAIISISLALHWPG